MKNEKELKTLLDVSRTVGSSLNLDEVNNLILKKAMEALNTDHASLFLLDAKNKHLMLAAARGFSRDEISNIAILGSWERINCQVTKKRIPLIVNNLRTHPLLSSFLSVPLKTKSKIIGVLIVSNKKGHPHIFAKDDKDLLMALANHVSIALLNAKLYSLLEDVFMSTIGALANAIDAKDPYTHGHSERVAKYAMAIAKKMNLSDGFIKNLKIASLLHDIGKIGIKDAILDKKEALTPEEYEIMRRHSVIGVNIVSSIIGSEKFIHGIVDHHERINGKGYPKGLRGDKISFQGKIIAIADTFDALTTERPYQKAFTPKEACLEISRGSGPLYDPKVIKAFLRSFSDENELWQA